MLIGNNKQDGEELSHAHESMEYKQVDISNESQAEAAANKTVKKFGKAECLVNCEGVLLSKTQVSEEEGPHDLDSWQKVSEINVPGTFNLNGLGAFAMRKNTPTAEYGERGTITNVARVAGNHGRTEDQDYGPRKGAIKGMVLPTARDISRFGIRVDNIDPDPMDTDMANLEKPRGESRTKCINSTRQIWCSRRRSCVSILD